VAVLNIRLLLWQCSAEGCYFGKAEHKAVTIALQNKTVNGACFCGSAEHKAVILAMLNIRLLFWQC